MNIILTVYIWLISAVRPPCQTTMSADIIAKMTTDNVGRHGAALHAEYSAATITVVQVNKHTLYRVLIATIRFYRAAWNADAILRWEFRPSVRLSNAVRKTRELWQNGRKICLDFYTIWKIIYPSFLRKRMFGGGDPFYLKFWVNRPALERNRRFWTDNRS